MSPLASWLLLIFVAANVLFATWVFVQWLGDVKGRCRCGRVRMGGADAISVPHRGGTTWTRHSRKNCRPEE